MRSTSNPNVSNFTVRPPNPSSPKVSPIATSLQPTPATTISPLRRAHGSSTPACAISRVKNLIAAPLPASRTLSAIASPATRTTLSAASSTSLTASTAPSPNPPPKSKTSRSSAPTACGQDHLTNTFKHLLIFEALDVPPPRFAHLPLLVAPDGAKLSKRKHGPVVSVTTYRDAGFLPQAFINFLCLLGWSPKDDREFLTLPELTAAFTLEGVNRANAVVNFSEESPFDPKAVFLNAEHIRALPIEQLSALLQPFFAQAGFHPSPEKLAAVTPLIRERIKLLRDAVSAADFFFLDQLPPYDPAELIPKNGDAALARRVLASGLEVLATTPFDHDSLDHALRDAATSMGLKAGQAFQPIRVAVCGRKNAPPLFETLIVLGRDLCLQRISQAEKNMQSLG